MLRSTTPRYAQPRHARSSHTTSRLASPRHTASRHAAQRAYRRVARDVHPDKPGGDAARKAAEEAAAVLLDKVYAGEMKLSEITTALAKCYMDSENGALAKLVMSSISL